MKYNTYRCITVSSDASRTLHYKAKHHIAPHDVTELDMIMVLRGITLKACHDIT